MPENETIFRLYNLVTFKKRLSFERFTQARHVTVSSAQHDLWALCDRMQYTLLRNLDQQNWPPADRFYLTNN